MSLSASSHTALLPWLHECHTHISALIHYLCSGWFWWVCTLLAACAVSEGACVPRGTFTTMMCSQCAGPSSYGLPVKQHRKVKTFSFSEGSRMMPGGLYCEWDFKTRFKNQPFRKAPNLNERQEKASWMRKERSDQLFEKLTLALYFLFDLKKRCKELTA